jgi:bacterioferritin
MPQPNPNVLKSLEDVLQSELAAINSYFIHAKLLAKWGYGKLSTKAYEESMDEMRHTEMLVDRIVYFDAIPNLNKIGRVKVGKTVREQFELALDLESAQVGRINGAIVICNEANDDGTRLVLEPMVTAGEASIDWLETQLAALDALGDTAYLAQQLA